MIQAKPLIKNILIAALAAVIGSIFSRNASEILDTLNTPPIIPPPWVFAVVWSILYLLMAISAYLIDTSNSADKNMAFTIYGIQLVLNIAWTFLFFELEAFWAAFVCILLLWISIIAMITVFTKIRPVAGYLQIPYLIWVTFAAVINISIAILN